MSNTNYIILTLLISSLLFSYERTTLGAESSITFSKESGFYNSEFQLTLTSSDNSNIFYTTDGSDPTNSQTAKQYSQPIPIKDRSQEPNIYSNYEENDNSAQSVSRGTGYKKPPFLVDKAMVVRAVAKSSSGYGKVIDRTYFITNGDLAQYQKYTVVSLVTNPSNLFDPDKGIYVTGNQYLNWKKSGSFNPGKNPWDTDNKCNYFSKGTDWEREATIEIFEKGTLSMQESVGIQIKGSSTRNTPQKSFNIYAREKYGISEFKSSTLFPGNADINGKSIDTYRSFTLRSVSDEARLRDKMVQDIIKNRKNIPALSMKSGLLFLNGEFWGLYTFVENISADTFSSHYNIPKNNLFVTKESDVQDGSEEELQKYLNFVDTYAKKDLTNQNNYNEVSNYIDIDSLIEHYVVGIYLGIWDWPNHNYGLLKNTGNKIDGNIYGDGKIRYICYDFDYTMGATYASFGGVQGYQYDNFRHMDNAKNESPTNLFVSLLKNQDFKKKFAAVINEYANDVASSDKMEALVNEYLRGGYSDLMAMSQTRWWGFFGGSEMENYSKAKSDYENKILTGIQTFFRERGRYVLDHMKKYLNL